MTPLPSNGKTYRYVSEQGAEKHVSSVPLTASEASDVLRVEVALHRAAGWQVNVYGSGLNQRITATRGGTRRVVTVEEVPR